MKLYTYYIRVNGVRRIEFIPSYSKEGADLIFSVRFGGIVDLALEESYPQSI